MLDSLVNDLILINTSVDVAEICAALAAGLVIGILVFLIYKVSTDEFEYDKGFGLALLLISTIVAALISAIGTNIARAFSVAGILALVRYRSAVIRPRELAFIFLSMATGFIAGIGFYIPSVILAIVVGIAILCCSSKSDKKNTKKLLRIAVPENIDYDGLFDDTLKKYTNRFSLKGVRIISGGTVTELTYAVNLKKVSDTKAFLDELRTKNGNFKIQLTEFAVNADQ